jgi:hypothetical protein
VPSPQRTKPTPTRIQTAEREAAALELRKTGATYEVIARSVATATEARQQRPSVVRSPRRFKSLLTSYAAWSPSGLTHFSRLCGPRR